MTTNKLKQLLDTKAALYNQATFIESDPISIPHLFSNQPDIEIAAFFSAIFSWGNRKIIIKKAGELMHLMDMAPHDFILNHQEKDLRNLLSFKHRTFNTTDLLYFIEWLHWFYTQHKSMEEAFYSAPGKSMKENLIGFHRLFFSLPDFPERTKKHISTPSKHSNCKRLNMFLRWMVRNDKEGVDFGLWHKLQPAELIIPVDLHVARVAQYLGLLTRKQVDWEAAEELTARLRKLDPEDPVKYDFALFGMGIFESRL